MKKPGDTVFWWCKEWEGVKEGRLIAVTEGIAAVDCGGDDTLIWAFTPVHTLRDSVQAAAADAPAQAWDANQATTELRAWLQVSVARKVSYSAYMQDGELNARVRLEHDVPNGRGVVASGTSWAAAVQEALTTWRASE